MSACPDGYEVKWWKDGVEYAAERKLKKPQKEALGGVKILLATRPYRVRCRTRDDGIRTTRVALAGCAIVYQIGDEPHCTVWIIKVTDIWPSQKG